MDEKYRLIDNFNYSQEEIQELVQEAPSRSTNISKLSYLLLLGTTTMLSSNVQQGTQVESPTNQLTIMTNNDAFGLEEYQNSLSSFEDYNSICLNVSKKEIIESILSFKSLDQSWDGYGALPLEIKSASNAISFLEDLERNSDLIIPDTFFPNPSGTISFIWSNNVGEKLSMEIGNSELSYYVKYSDLKPKFYSKIPISEANIDEITRQIKSLV